jgi:hypothetical protein
MGRKKKLKPDDPEQSARFIETAKEIQAEDAEERFEKAMKQIVISRLKKPPQDANDSI